MKKQYQSERQRAVQQLRRIAVEQNPNVQMILPLAGIIGRRRVAYEFRGSLTFNDDPGNLRTAQESAAVIEQFCQTFGQILLPS